MSEQVVARGTTRLNTIKHSIKWVEVPADMPGVVIFLHGVNDPGASYEAVETGLCKGVNERLDRVDLQPGRYGADFKEASDRPSEDRRGQWKEIFDDPDTYLYQRQEAEKAASLFIPFYWGYRAAPDEIKRDDKGDPTRLRGQFQDIHNNRLDRHFAKGGGFFANATNNILEMYGRGFNKFIRHLAQTVLGNTLYMGQAPSRSYFILAAARLASLISEIRRIAPNDTITVMGHSQGTLITLLAQAMLVDQGQRCADCLVMVASPYSVLPDSTPQYSHTLQTLVDIVSKVTAAPHAEPPLASLRFNERGYNGRTGPQWSPEQGTRLGPDGTTQVFPERDNRGKVYLYFSHDDSTVGLSDVSGIGTFGVPDKLPDGTPALDTLHGLRFYQRLWSKRRRHDLPIPVGDTPGPVALRDKGEGGTALPKWSFSAIAQRRSAMGETRRINAEALVPVHQPDMFGGEHKPGIDRPDAVSQNNALGNPRANFKRTSMGYRDKPFDVAAEQARWNEGKEDEECAVFTQTELEGHHYQQRNLMYQLWREETPSEIRKRMAKDPAEWEANSYHSAVLRSAVNHQWVTAMDIAIGQAECLDDADMRKVLLAMADWRMTKEQYDETKEFPGFGRLSPRAQLMIEAASIYYDNGTFPFPDLVPLTLPSLVKGRLPEGEPSR